MEFKLELGKIGAGIILHGQYEQGTNLVHSNGNAWEYPPPPSLI